MKPDSAELKFDKWKDKIRKGAVWLPHGMVANSPGNPTWDTTGGKFGPFGGQMFLGDQTLSNLFRVVPSTCQGKTFAVAGKSLYLLLGKASTAGQSIYCCWEKASTVTVVFAAAELADSSWP